METLADMLARGGPVMALIGALSVLSLALILWKLWWLMRAGAFAGARAEAAVAAWCRGERTAARAALTGRLGLRARLVAGALDALEHLPDAAAREEVTRLARRDLAQARAGLGALDLIAAVAPLLGLLGTVLGMIAAFQALQAAGAQAEPTALAGGIWEALLTTAAGMAVAIPAALAEGWFEGVIARAEAEMEDMATRLFVAAAVTGATP